MERLLKNSEAAEMLGVTAATLSNWRYLGHGPRYFRHGSGQRGGVVRYRESDIRAYLDKRLVAPEEAYA